MNGSEAYVLGIDIGGTNMRFGLVDGSHRLSAFERQSTRDTFLEDCDPAPVSYTHLTLPTKA